MLEEHSRSLLQRTLTEVAGVLPLAPSGTGVGSSHHPTSQSGLVAAQTDAVGLVVPDLDAGVTRSGVSPTNMTGFLELPSLTTSQGMLHYSLGLCR